MRIVFFFWFTLVGTAAEYCMASPAAVLQEPWQKPYTAGDSNGPHVVAYWSFDGPQPTTDISGHGHDGVLEGATIDSNGKFGACLRSYRGWPATDKPHRMRVPNRAALSPKGAFALELWINPDAKIKDYPESFLIDKKYVADADYQLILGSAAKDGTRTLRANLGFSNRSVSWYSTPVHFSPGTWYHIAFVYDGRGLGRFFINGRLRGSRQEDGVTSIQPGRHPLFIGDRVGSYYHGFPGRIDQVRLTTGNRQFGPLAVARLSDRTNFRRMEPNATLRFRITNLKRTVLRGLHVAWSIEGATKKTENLAVLESGAAREITFALDTRLRPDTYQLELQADAPNDAACSVQREFVVRIVPRLAPDRFPVVMWGAGPSELERLRRIGFTYALGVGADYGRIWQAGKPVPPADPERLHALRQSLDEALPAGVSFAASLSPGSYLRRDKHFLRIGRDGKPRTKRPDICGLFPRIADFCFHVGQSVAGAYGDLPAFRAALLHTEVRDAAQPCFHKHDYAAYRKATGAEIPAQVNSRWGVNYAQLPNFPKDHVIPDDDPIYQYYRWYWKAGDGWNHLNSELRRGLHSMHRDDFWTWHDPAVRVASVYGSGGNVDVISQWTYSYPDPIRIGVATDELLAMARGAEHPQRVMKMTQIIWYRSQTAPAPKSPNAGPRFKARWELQQPDAPFITIAPMHLREAFWTKMARPISGIMYHGWQSLVPVKGQYGYRYTNPATQFELQRLIHEIVRPLGPTLLHVPGIQSDCAFYESFAAQMFAGRGTYGWSGKWIGDAYQATMWAGLQPEIIYDETIVQHGLKAYKILFMMNCDVITRSVAEKIRQFQQRGGIVIGDEHTAPGIKPDITLPIYKRTGIAATDKQQLLQVAARLRAALANCYERYVDSDNPNVIPYRRRYRDTDYLFLINDAREYGHYVGQHRLVMENGLPARATIMLARTNVHVYDLVRHRQVTATDHGQQMELSVQLDPCAGRLFMITSQPIATVKIAAPKHVDLGAQAKIAVRIVDPQDHLVPAVLPVEVAIDKPNGQHAEYSGYWAAIGGQVAIPLDIATNAQTGIWTVKVSELASGKSATSYVRVGDRPTSQNAATVDKKLANPVQPRG